MQNKLLSRGFEKKTVPVNQRLGTLRRNHSLAQLIVEMFVNDQTNRTKIVIIALYSRLL